MQKIKINLEEIIDNQSIRNLKITDYIVKDGLAYKMIKNAIEEGIKQVLELAAENAKLLYDGKFLNSNRCVIEKDDTFYSDVEIGISKQSILDTIKQVD